MVTPIPRHVDRNWVLEGFNQQEERNQQRREQEQQQALDRAMREGLQEMYGPQQGPVQPPASVGVTNQPDGVPGGGMQTPQQPQGGGGRPPGPAGGGQPQPQQRQAGMGGVPGSTNPILRRLIAQPGGGQAAFDLYQQQAQQQAAAQQREDEMEMVAIEALGKGDLATFRYFQQRTGIQVPEEIVNDATARRNLAVGAELATKFYSGDKAQAQRFAAAFLQSGGDAMAAWNAAGPPRDKPNVSLQTVMHEGQRVLARMGDGGQFMGFVQGPGGQPLQADAGTGAAGRSPASIQEAQTLATWMARAEGREPTHEDMVNAYQTARMAKENPQGAAATLAGRLMGQTDMAGRPLYTPEQAQQTAIEMVQGFSQSFGGNAYGAGQGQQAPQLPQEPSYDFEFDPESGQLVPANP